MKNNTKLIMETWRRFLKEGPIDDIEGFYGKDYDPSQEEDENSINKPLPGEAPFEEEDPVPVDGMADGNSQPFDDEYNPEGIDPLDYYGDPGSEEVLGVSGDHDEEFDDDDTSKENVYTYLKNLIEDNSLDYEEVKDEK